MVDVKESKDVVVVLGRVAGALKASLEDKKLDVSDAPKFLSAVMALPAAVEGASEVFAELKDLSLEEGLQLAEAGVAEVGVMSPELSAVVKDSLSLLLAGGKLGKSVQALLAAG